MTTLYASEKLWVPVHTLAVSFRSFLPLHVFDLSLSIGCYILISPFYSLAHIMPELLRFAVVLFFQRSSRWWGVFSMCCIEK